MRKHKKPNPNAEFKSELLENTNRPNADNKTVKPKQLIQ